MSSKRFWGLYLPLILALAGAAAFAVDIPIAHAFRRWNRSPVLADYLEYCDIFEIFGHGMGVVLILIVIHQLDPSRRWAIPRLTACALTGGIFADLIKLLIVRTRPYAFHFQGFHGTVWETFGKCLPILSGGSGGQSFPSAHTATAVAMAGALLWLYPRGRWLFPLLAVLVGCQRIQSNAHFPSDVLFGAVLGCLSVRLFIYGGWVSRKFDSLELGLRKNPVSQIAD